MLEQSKDAEGHMVFTIVLGVVALALILLFPGFFLVSRLLPQRATRCERLSVIILLSTGINSIALFYLGIVNGITLVNTLVIYLLLNLVTFHLLGNRVEFRGDAAKQGIVNGIYQIRTILLGRIRNPGRIDVNTIITILVIVILLFEFYLAMTLPFIAWDAVGRFGVATSKILHSGGFEFLDHDYPDDPINNGYPQLSSLLRVWIYSFSGERVERIAHVLYPLFGVIALFYTGLLSNRMGNEGNMALLLLLCTPWFLVHINAGYAEIIVTAYLMASLFYAIECVSNDFDTRYLFLSGFFGGLMAFTKPQGLFIFMALPLGFVLASYVIDRKGTKSLPWAVLMLIGTLIIGAQWWIRIVMHDADYFTRTLLYRHESRTLVGIYGAGYEEFLNRPITMMNELYARTPPVLVLVFFLGAIHLLYRITRRTRGPEDIFLAGVVFPYLAIWPFVLSQIDDLVYILPILAILATRVLSIVVYSLIPVLEHLFERTGVDGSSTRDRMARAISLIVFILLFYDPIGKSLVVAINGSNIGTGIPPINWAMSHPFSSDKEKRAMYLGKSFADMVDLLAHDPRLQEARIITLDPRFGAYLNNAIHRKIENMSEAVDFEYLIIPHDWSAASFNDYWWGPSEVRRSIQLEDTPFIPKQRMGDTVLYEIDNERLAACVMTHLGERNEHPLSMPFIVTNGTDPEYVFLESEDFLGFTTYDTGWAISEKIFRDDSYRVAFSIASVPRGKGISATFDASSGNHTLWIRHAIWHFTPSNYTVEINSHQRYYVHLPSGNGTEDHLEWMKMGTVDLEPFRNRINFTTASTWVGIDLVLLTTNHSYVPRGSSRPSIHTVRGMPEYDIGDTGIYVGEDGGIWRIRWTRNDTRQVRGSIKNSTAVTKIEPYALEDNDVLLVTGGSIMFEGISRDDEDGIDIVTEGGSVELDLGIQ